jgi:hypothetical protein
MTALYSSGDEIEIAHFNVTPQSPMKNLGFVYTAADLYNVRSNLGYYNIQMADIDLSSYASGSGWTPIGDYTSPTVNHPFTGIFDGNGHVIRNLTITGIDSYRGLFGYTSGSTLKNIGLIDVDVSGFSNIGGLAGNFVSTKINNCYATGQVTGSGSGSGFMNVGGLVGTAESSSEIRNCYTAVMVIVGTVLDTVSHTTRVGGLVGFAYSGTIITDCHATGNITSTVTGQDCNVGGLVGVFDGSTISNCYATGTATGKTIITGNTYAGGLVGSLNSGTISNSHATGKVTGSAATTTKIGGLAGAGYGSISNCYATGEITGSIDTGGLVGYFQTSTGSISNCYATGSVDGSNGVGGLVGRIAYGTINNCYATGSIGSSSSIYVGGFIGINQASEAYQTITINYCYATGHVSGSSNVGGFTGGQVGSGTMTTKACYYDSVLGGPVNGIGTPKTTTEMKTQGTFMPGTNNWDFTTIWSINGSINNGYPYLTALRP